MNRFLEYDGYTGTVDYSKEDALFYGMLQGVEDYKVLKRIEAIKRKKYGI